MSAEANKALVRRYFEAIDVACEAGNAAVVDEFLAPDFVEHNPFPGVPPTREGWKQAFTMFVNGAPGYHVVEDLVAEGDKVAGRITAYGKHEGELFGIPATRTDIRVTAEAATKADAAALGVAGILAAVSAVVTRNRNGRTLAT